MMSRLLPTPQLEKKMSMDPWDWDEQTLDKLVYLYARGSNGQEIPYSPTHPVAKDVTKKLQRINRINSNYEITCRFWQQWEKRYSRRKQIRPVHFAVFTDSFDLHGRIYTGQNGHQGLRRIERATIRFGRQPVVELDYSGLHTRMLYHLEGMEYDEDPYALWGSRTTNHQRILAKQLINTLINADSEKSAVAACNRAMSHYTGAEDADGNRIKKKGKALEDSRELYDAHQAAKLKFYDILPLVYRQHAPVAHRFGNDTGIKLMRIDSEIALEVMYAISQKHIPVLGCHDSFIVPEEREDLLTETMSQVYEARLGFTPVIR